MMTLDLEGQGQGQNPVQGLHCRRRLVAMFISVYVCTNTLLGTFPLSDFDQTCTVGVSYGPILHLPKWLLGMLPFPSNGQKTCFFAPSDSKCISSYSSSWRVTILHTMVAPYEVPIGSRRNFDWTPPGGTMNF